MASFTLLHFHAPWSPPSVSLLDLLQAQAARHTRHAFRTIDVDQDAGADEAEHWSVQEIPECILLKVQASFLFFFPLSNVLCLSLSLSFLLLRFFLASVSLPRRLLLESSLSLFAS